MTKKAVFLDRDGVVNDNAKPVNRPEDLILYPWAAPAIRRLKEAGYAAMIVTNQGGVELGFFSEADLSAVHRHMDALLRRQGAVLDDIAFCPHFHHPCNCRKPKPGMILDLARKHGIDPSRSWMIGDREPDILAGIAAGCRTVKLGDPHPQADFNCARLDEAVEFIIRMGDCPVEG